MYSGKAKAKKKGVCLCGVRCAVCVCVCALCLPSNQTYELQLMCVVCIINDNEHILLLSRSLRGDDKCDSRVPLLFCSMFNIGWRALSLSLSSYLGASRRVPLQLFIAIALTIVFFFNFFFFRFYCRRHCRHRCCCYCVNRRRQMKYEEWN